MAGKWLTKLILLSVMAAIAGPVGAQEVDAPRDSEAKVVSSDYRLGPGDLLSIQVFGLDEFDQLARVSNSGKIRMPYLGLIIVDGLTPMQLESEICRRLEVQELVKDPKVRVFITEYRGRPVYCLGEVMMPGQFVIMDKQMTLMDLLTMAGGVNDVASETAYLYRRGAPERSDGKSSQEEGTGDGLDYQVIPVDVDALRDGSALDLNVNLRGGDVFYVPERKREFYYVVGDVGVPGAYEIPRGEALLASQAISAAGGPTRTAKMSEGTLVRNPGSASRTELDVDFEAIVKGKSPDFPVRPDDIIFVPGSAAKTIGYGLLGIIPGLARSAVVEAPRRR